MVVDVAAIGEMPVESWSLGILAGFAQPAGFIQRASAAVAAGPEAEHQCHEGFGQLAMVCGLPLGAHVTQLQRRPFDGLDLEVEVFGRVNEGGVGRGAQEILVTLSIALKQQVRHKASMLAGSYKLGLPLVSRQASALASKPAPAAPHGG